MNLHGEQEVRGLEQVDSWLSRHPLARARMSRVEAGLIRARLIRGQHRYEKFIIVSRARTGSNLLVSLLNSHPQVEARGELFREMNGQSVAARLDEVFGDKPRRIGAAGFKIFYYHPRDDPDSRIWDALDAIDTLRVIHLKRRNTLRTLTSRKLARSTDVWLDRGHSDAGSEKPKVEFSVKELEDAFEENERWEAAFDDRFRNHEQVELYYEDLVVDPTVLATVTEFLGVRPRAMSTSLRQQNPEALSALISNFDDLRQHFLGSRWSRFFDDE